MSGRRRGTVLIIVAGVSALLAALGLAFLMRMRADEADVQLALRQAQARAMLHAACSYVLEAGRIGWDDPATPAIEECYGWIDVRDGFMGPKPTAFTLAQRAAHDPATFPSPNFPVGTTARFDLHCWTRPPWAISPRMTPNPIRTPTSDPPVDIADPRFGLPLLLEPDPQPLGATFAEHAAGDPTPVAATRNLCWFRVRRDGPATFTITCGAGGSHGFRSWAEVDPASREALFYGDERVWAEQVANEMRAWYRIAWSPALAFFETNMVSGDGRSYTGHPRRYRTDLKGWSGYVATHDLYNLLGAYPSAMNVAGTIAWVQRLHAPPQEW